MKVFLATTLLILSNLIVQSSSAYTPPPGYDTNGQRLPTLIYDIFITKRTNCSQAGINVCLANNIATCGGSSSSNDATYCFNNDQCITFANSTDGYCCRDQNWADKVPTHPGLTQNTSCTRFQNQLAHFTSFIKEDVNGSQYPSFTECAFDEKFGYPLVTAFTNANYTPQNGGQTCCPKFLDAVEVNNGLLGGSALCVSQFYATSNVSGSGGNGSTGHSGGISLHENLFFSGCLLWSFAGVIVLNFGLFM